MEAPLCIWLLLAFGSVKVFLGGLVLLKLWQETCKCDIPNRH